MNRHLTILTWGASLVALSAAVASMAHTADESRGLANLFDVVAECKRAESAEKDAKAAERKAQDVMSRIREKATIAQEVASGQITLVEAASRYRKLHEDKPLHLPGANGQTITEAETYCRNVINFVRYSGDRPKEEKEEAADRLEGELATLLCVQTLELPDVP
jgi:hypothetical protein